MSQAASSNIVFDDIFRINAIDREGKKFDRGASLSLYIMRRLTIVHQSHVYTRTHKIMTWT